MSKSAKTATAQSTEKPEKTNSVTKKITKRVVEIPAVSYTHLTLPTICSV